MLSWLSWAIVLLIQNASFTWVSRARNSKSVRYHAVASVCSNLVWFASQIIVVSKITDALKSNNTSLLMWTALFYTTFTVLGSIGAHHLLMTKVETGNRKIG